MQKKAIKPNPQHDPGPPAFSNMQSFSSLQIKSFLLGVLLCFHPQSGLKNPEHLKFLHMSSMHQGGFPGGGESTLLPQPGSPFGGRRRALIAHQPTLEISVRPDII
jgi:hypothetical protein